MSDHDHPTLSRRRLLRAGSFTTTALGMPGSPGSGRLGPLKGKPAGTAGEFLILMFDEMRFPPVYESAALKAFWLQYLQTQNMLRRNGVGFRRHYAASVACSPSRTSLYTGQYPSFAWGRTPIWDRCGVCHAPVATLSGSL
jgi:choline-sulfatase